MTNGTIVPCSFRIVFFFCFVSNAMAKICFENGQVSIVVEKRGDQ